MGGCLVVETACSVQGGSGAARSSRAFLLEKVLEDFGGEKKNEPNGTRESDPDPYQDTTFSFYHIIITMKIFNILCTMIALVSSSRSSCCFLFAKSFRFPSAGGRRSHSSSTRNPNPQSVIHRALSTRHPKTAAVVSPFTSSMTNNQGETTTTTITANTRPSELGVQDSESSTISNKDTILNEIDQALGVKKPPDVEVLLTDHLAYVANPLSRFLHLNVMRFGHIAIRYTTSDGQQRVMNILGDFDEPDAQMINFVKPQDYIYGTQGWETYAQQGGVYNRPFVGVRIENVSSGATDAMHAYYCALAKASEIGTEDMGGSRPGTSNQGAARFQLVEVQLSKLARAAPAPIDKMLYKAADFFREAHEKSKKLQNTVTGKPQISDGSVSEGNKLQKGMMDVRQAVYNSGNCAQWTSSGLSFAGLIRRPRLFPKNILIDLFEEEVLKYNRPNNVNVVYYEEIAHSQKRDPNYKYLKPAMVSPIKPIRNIFYHDMKKFAHAIVSVPTNSTTAVVHSQKPLRRPGKWLMYLNGVTFYVPAIVAAGLVHQIGPMGPTMAVVWLLANYWLY